MIITTGWRCTNRHNNKLKYIGWEVEFQGDLDNLAAELSDKGIEVTAGSAALREQRSVMDLFVINGPDDIRLEIFFGPVQDFKPFTPKRGMEGLQYRRPGHGTHCLSHGRQVGFGKVV